MMTPYEFGYGYGEYPDPDFRQINRSLRFIAKKLARKTRRKNKD